MIYFAWGSLGGGAAIGLALFMLMWVIFGIAIVVVIVKFFWKMYKDKKSGNAHLQTKNEQTLKIAILLIVIYIAYLFIAEALDNLY